MPNVKTNIPGYYGSGSVIVGEPPLSGEGPTRRCALSKDALITRPLEGINTVYDIITYASRTHGTRNALGWRDIINVIEEEKEVHKIIDGKEVTQKKKWKYFELSDYKYINFIQLEEAISEAARALVYLGVKKGDVFNVYAQTRCVLLSTNNNFAHTKWARVCQSQLADYGPCNRLDLGGDGHELRYVRRRRTYSLPERAGMCGPFHECGTIAGIVQGHWEDAHYQVHRIRRRAKSRTRQ